MVKNNVDLYNSSIEEENRLLKSIEELRVKIIERKDNIKTAKLVEKLSLAVAGLGTLSSTGLMFSNYSVGYLFLSVTFLGVSMNCASSARIFIKGEEKKIVENEQMIEKSSGEVERVKLVREYTEQLSSQFLSNNKVNISDSKTSSKGKTKVRNINDDK